MAEWVGHQGSETVRTGSNPSIQYFFTPLVLILIMSIVFFPNLSKILISVSFQSVLYEIKC